jgi:hypothetical protein
MLGTGPGESQEKRKQERFIMKTLDKVAIMCYHYNRGSKED